MNPTTLAAAATAATVAAATGGDGWSMSWLAANWIVVLTSIVTIASAIAAITPTPADDAITGRLYKIVDALALNVGKAKDK